MSEKPDEELGSSQDEFEPLVNKKLLVLAAYYFYQGTLTGFNERCIQITDCEVVHYADDFDPAKWKKATANKLPAKVWNIERTAIESFGELE